MKYGYFDDNNKEYVITTPRTPLPWINYLGSEAFFTLLSNTGGGYAFYKDARLRRITRYRYNNCPFDMEGFRIYVRDGAEVWNPGWMPVRNTLDSYKCRHGLGYSVIEGTKNGLKASQTFMVPQGDDCLLMKLELENKSGTRKTFDVFSYIEFCLWDAMDDSSNFQRNFSCAEVEIEPNAIYHKTEYRERRDHYAVYWTNETYDGFDTSRDAFCGHYSGAESPEAVFGNPAAPGKEGTPENGTARGSETDSGNETGCRSSIASGWAPVGAMQFHVTLDPGERKSLILGLGYIENAIEEKWQKGTQPGDGIINKDKAHEMIRRYPDADAFDKALDTLKTYWDGLLSNYQLSLDSGDEQTDARLSRMVNIWNQYQCMVTFNMSRSASYFESGMGRGMGFRDSCQDLLGFVHIIPERARERILDIAATQFPDGSAYHQYQPLTKKGNLAVGSGFNDDPLWLVAGTWAYIAETGDFGILDEMVDFDNDPELKQPLMEHLRRSVHYTITHLGPHKLPLIGRADWNDCLNLNCFSDTPGESFQTTGPSEGPVAESVFIGGMFVKYGRAYADICRSLAAGALTAGTEGTLTAGAAGAAGTGTENAGEHTADNEVRKAALLEEAQQVEEAVKDMESAVLSAGWDGEWFIRAYDAFGQPVGSSSCDEGQIFIEPQGMCVMAEIGKETGEAARALKSVEERLDTKYGIVLLQPAYTSYRLNLGEISSYPPGYKENAGIFCHNNPWIVAAETVLGHGNRAFDIYRKTCPAFIEDISEIHRTEPYVYSQMVAGRDAVNFGEAKNSWLTGTAAWTFACVSQNILGIRPELEGLRVNPVIPESWNGFRIKRTFRGTVYDITVSNQSHVQQGISSAVMDGAQLPVGPDGTVLLPPVGREYAQVAIVM